MVSHLIRCIVYILNFQESTTILNTYPKISLETYWRHHVCLSIQTAIFLHMWTNGAIYMCACICIQTCIHSAAQTLSTCMYHTVLAAGGANTLTAPLQRGKILATSVLDMTLNCIWWWGSSPRALMNYHYFQIHSGLEWLYLLAYHLWVN